MQEKESDFIKPPKQIVTSIAVTATVLAGCSASVSGETVKPKTDNTNRMSYDLEGNLMRKDIRMKRRLHLAPVTPPDEAEIVALKSGNTFLERIEKPKHMKRPHLPPVVPSGEPIISSELTTIKPSNNDVVKKELTKKIRKIPPLIEYKEDTNNSVDVVEREGVEGEYEDTIETVFIGKEKKSEKVINSKQLKAPVNTIIVKGTKKVTHKTETKEVLVEPETEYIDDNTITEDVVFIEGKQGTIIQTLDNIYTNNVLTESKVVSSKVETPVVNRVVKRAKPIYQSGVPEVQPELPILSVEKGVPETLRKEEGKITKNKSEHIINIEPETEYIDDDTIVADVVKTQGESGKTIQVIETTLLNGNILESNIVETRIEKPVVNKVIRRAVPPKTSKGTPEIQQELPELVVTEKGTPEILQKEEGQVTKTIHEHIITIEPETNYIDDNTLTEDVIENQGEQGKTIQVVETTLLNGKVVESNIVETIIEKPVVNKVVRRGTKKIRKEIVEKRIPVESKTEYVDDNTIVANIVSQGYNGEIIQKVENTYENDVLTSSKIISSTINKPVQNTIIRRAVPPITSKGVPEVLDKRDAVIRKEYEEKKTPIEPKVEYVNDETIVNDVTESLGKKGELTETIEHLYVDNVLVSSGVVKSEITTPVKNTIIRKSTMKTSKGDETPPVVEVLPEAVITKKRTTKTTPVPFKVIEREDPSVNEGVIKATGGVDGSVTRTFDEYYVDGNLVDSREVGEPQSIPAVNKIITKGTKQIPKITMETRWVDENNKDIKQKITQTLSSMSEYTPVEPGESPKGYILLSTQNGEHGTTYVYKKLPFNRDLTINDKVEKKVETKRVPIKFKTNIREDKTLPKGAKIVDVVGVDGYTETTSENHYINGELVLSIPQKTSTVNAVNQEERIGVKEVAPPKPPIVDRHIPGISVKLVSETRIKTVNLDPIIEYDNQLPEGTENILDNGTPKRIEQTFEVTKVNGITKNEKMISERVVDKGTPKRVKVGTMRTTTERDFIIEDEELQPIYVDDPNLDSGETEVLDNGTPSKIQKTVEKTLVNGVVKNTRIIDTHILKQGTPKRIKRGTRVVKRTVDIAKIQDTSANQGLKENDVLKSGRTVRTLIIKDDKSIQDVMNLSDKERYEKAQKSGTINQMNSYTGNDSGRLIASTIPMSKGTENYINSHLDDKKFNLEMLKLVNAERNRLGKKSLVYGEHLQQGANLRAYEQAMIGHLRTNGKPHTRPNNTTFRTAFTYLNNDRQSEMEQTLGENIAQYSASNLYQVTSEKDMAEKLYEQWRKSPGHYANMISDDYKYIAFTARVGQTNNLNPEYSDVFYSVIGVQTFQADVPTPTEANTRSSDESLAGGYLAGDKLGNLKILQPSNKDIMWKDVANDKDKDKKALDSKLVYYTLVKEENSRYLYPSLINKKIVDKWNDGSLVNHKQIENKVIELVNKDRNNKGLSNITVAQPLEEGNRNRVLNMVDYGAVKEGYKNGSWDSAYGIATSSYSSVGEIYGGISVSANPYATVSENHIANEIFKRIKSTPSHYNILMKKDLSSINLGVGLTTNDKTVEGATLGMHKILYVLTTSKK